MIKNHNLASSIADASFGELVRQLEYKAKWYGRTLIKVDTFYPSSQLCHICGYKNSEFAQSGLFHLCPSGQAAFVYRHPQDLEQDGRYHRSGYRDQGRAGQIS